MLRFLPSLMCGLWCKMNGVIWCAIIWDSLLWCDLICRFGYPFRIRYDVMCDWLWLHIYDVHVICNAICCMYSWVIIARGMPWYMIFMTSCEVHDFLILLDSWSGMNVTWHSLWFIRSCMTWLHMKSYRNMACHDAQRTFLKKLLYESTRGNKVDGLPRAPSWLVEQLVT